MDSISRRSKGNTMQHLRARQTNTWPNKKSIETRQKDSFKYRMLYRNHTKTK